MIRLVLAVVVVLPLWGCGPVPVEQAERICIQDARLAQRPRGTVGFGVASDGRTAANLQIGISSDFLTGRDPDAVYASCVYQRSGQSPSRPFSTLPESRG